MKDPTAVMCHNIAKYDRDHNTPAMTTEEAAERAAYSSNRLEEIQLSTPCDDDVIALQDAIDALQKIASGELKEVVHGHLKDQWSGEYNNFANCSVCGATNLDGSNWCSSCGARMDRSNNGEKAGEPDA